MAKAGSLVHVRGLATGTRPRDLVWWMQSISRPTQALLDVLVLIVAFGLAYLMRFDFVLSPLQERRALLQLPLVVGLQVLAFAIWGVYSFIWRYVGLAETRAFLGGALSAAVPLLLLRMGLPDSLAEWRVPASVVVTNAVLGFGGALGLRVLRRVLFERYERQESQEGTESERAATRTLLVGAGRAGVLAAREILGRGDLKIDVRGFVDDDPMKLGSVVHGIRVVGRTTDIPSLLEKHEIEGVIITIASASRNDIRRIVGICEACGVRPRIFPGLYEILGGRVRVSQIRGVEIGDLLGREAVQLDDEGIRRFLVGRRVDRRGAGETGGSLLSAGGPARGANGVRALQDRRGDGTALPRPQRRSAPRRRHGRSAPESRFSRLQAPGGHPRGGAQARTARRAERRRGGQEQRLLRAHHRGDRRGVWCGDLHPHLDRQGRNPTSIMGATKRAAELSI